MATDGRLKRAMELANKLEARYVLIAGENEISSESYTLKDMRSGEQESVPLAELVERLHADH